MKSAMRYVLNCRTTRLYSLIFVFVLSADCARQVAVQPENADVKSPVIFGRIQAVILGKTSRAYDPKVRFLELMNVQTKERYSVDVESDNTAFVLPIPAGRYELRRVQISEGPFLSMADYVARFDVFDEELTYLGTWRFGIDTPRQNRMMVFSAVHDQDEQDQVQQDLLIEHPDLNGTTVRTVLPSPNEIDAQLYEVMPYPRFQTYFRRHW